MKRSTARSHHLIRNWILPSLLLLAGLLIQTSALAFQLTVVDAKGDPITVPFRWQVEEDNTVHHIAGELNVNNSVTLSIHKSHAPVVKNGTSAVNPATIDLPSDQHYYVTVLAEGYQLGGINVAAGQPQARLIVNAHPIPTAQISVFAFEDHFAINNFPDIGEKGLPGFTIKLYDGAGYFAAGDLSQDAFGNPLGTTYKLLPNGEFDVDAEGNPVVELVGSGAYVTDANGEALIKYIAPGKYGVQIIPRDPETGGDGGWVQTTTIEGTVGIDAWVKGNEPVAMIEFGLASKHIFQGFINPKLLPWGQNPPAGGATISGRLVNNHYAKPPELTPYPGAPVEEGWIALNDLLNTGGGVYAAPCSDVEGHVGEFTISNVPDGTYQLVTFDKPLLRIIGFTTVLVANGQSVNLGDVTCNAWFGNQEGFVFYDNDQDGFRDDGELGIPLQNVNLRFRDGTMYGNTLTDLDGAYGFPEIFPFFKWLITEIDFARFKATGMTTVVDDGGQVPPHNGWEVPSFGKLTPQPQAEVNPATGFNTSRTEEGPVLTQAFQNYAGMINWIDWGKINYGPDENGGISGIVFYSTTRAENDVREAAGDPWEPGVPRVQMALYRDANADQVIDDQNGDGIITLADVDNYPLGWSEGGPQGSEDINNGGGAEFDLNDAIQVAWTDSWDDNPPRGAIHEPPPIMGQQPASGVDSYGTWNQVRPGVFDGGYAFNDIPAGMYIVQTFPPPGYLLQTEESINVGFGDAFTPSKLALLPECVGTEQNHGGATYVSSIVPTARGTAPYTVASELTLFAGEPAPFAGDVRPLADMKWVRVANDRNGAADFHIYTEVPKAARAVGLVNNDVGAAFNPAFPNFGEKDTPIWIPISFQDWAGNEVNRVYADPFGGYNALLPSTYSVHVPMPSGVSPNMVVVVLNDPTMPDPNNLGQRIPDPQFDPDYATSAYPLQYFPGTTTYPDTPVLPVGAFVGGPNKRMDVEPPSGTPMIHSAEGPGDAGAGTGGPLLLAGEELTIRSLGPTQVANPEASVLDVVNGIPLMITRDYGFGNVPGTVTLNGIPLTIVPGTWTDASVRVTAPLGTPTGRLLVTRGDNGLTSRLGVTVTIGQTGHRVVNAAPYPATPIQDAIDAAIPGELILVRPGEYQENVIMWKPVRLQGSGMGTIINARPLPPERLAIWHAKAAEIYGTPGTDPFEFNAMAGITVVGDAGHLFDSGHQPRIDGFRILGAQTGGGIYAHNGAHYLQVSNNRIQGNRGNYAGGVSVGIPGAGAPLGNDFVVIKDNEILKNGMTAVNAMGGAGGVGLFTGADNYEVRNNLIQGNLSTANGGGIAHLGLSPNGRIEGNQILFNEVISDVLGYGAGGGIYLAGESVLGALTAGAGTVTVNDNLIQGNLGGAGHGGGIRAERFNGQDAVDSNNQNNWHALNIFNNTIVNNVAGFAGGGISLEDVARSRVIHNTIANNDSTSTAALAFLNAAANSEPQGAGVVGHPHSAQVAAATGQYFANPTLFDNIIWHNRSWYLDITLNELVANPAGLYQDLQVFAATDPVWVLNPQYCILSDATGYAANNLSGDPQFAGEYLNTLLHASVPDEARRATWIRFPEINPQGDYHIAAGSPAVGAAESSFLDDFSELLGDTDGEYRPGGTPATPDIGADEVWALPLLVTAVNDIATMNENGPTISGNVLANDSENVPGTAVLRVVLVRGPSHSRVFSLNLTAGGARGNFTYRSVANYAGQDSFTYRAYVNGTTHYSLEATVTITILPINRAPTALVDNYTANGHAVLSIPAPGVLANDGDADGDALSAILVTQPNNNGSVTLNADGSFTYTARPSGPYPRTDRFQYQASDGLLVSPVRNVNVQVQTPRPDFTVTGIEIIPQPVYTGTPLTARVTVQNVGVVAGDAGTLSVWLNQPDGAPGTPADATVPAGVLAGGASTMKEFALTAPDAPSPVVFRAYVNSTGTPASEFSLANNQVTQEYIVRTGTSFQTLPVDNDGEDTDGDGDPNNDFVYAHVAGTDGYAMMGDGYELYNFGFTDHTATTLALANTYPQMVIPTVMLNGVLQANACAPTLVLKEGQYFYLDLSTVGMFNRPDLFDPHTVHFHGFPNAASIFDGEPMASLAINAGASFRYFYYLTKPGTFIWHCHVEATEHMEMGMLGTVYVMAKQNNLPDGTLLGTWTHRNNATTQDKYAYNDGDGSTRYDVEFPLQIGGYDKKFHDANRDVQPLPFATLDEDYPVINGRGYPDTANPNPIANVSTQERLGLDAPYEAQKISSLITAKQGQRILLRLNNVALSDFHTITVLGIPMRVVGKDANLLRGPDPDGAGPLRGKDLTYQTTSVTTGGGETMDLILDTTNVTPGTYFLYDARLNHLSNYEEDFGGMMTEIIIEAP